MRRVGESLRSFLLRLQQQAAKCVFGDQLDIQLRDRIVAGVNDLEVQKRLLREQELTFQRAKQIIEDWDDVNNAIASVSEVLYGQKQQRTGQRFSGKTVPRRKPIDSKQSNNTSTCKLHIPPQHKFEAGNKTCDSCGGLHPRKTCRFREAVCRACNRKGHIAKVCRSERSVNYTYSKGGLPIKPIDDNSSDKNARDFSLSADSNLHLFHTLRYKNGQTWEFIVDTGSPATFMSLTEFHKLGFNRKQLHATSATIRGVSGHPFPVVGQSTIVVHRDQSNHTSAIKFIITK